MRCDSNRLIRLSRKAVFVACVASSVFASTVATAGAHSWQVRSSSELRIDVDLSTLLRDDFDATQFFGFNLNYFAFQRQLWDRKNNRVKPIVTKHLKDHFPGSRYRYPGGMVANGFDWQGSLGAYETRKSHRNLYGNDQARPAFGVDEYARFLQQIGGSAWYVLNLVGTDAQRPWTQGNVDLVSARNAKLSEYLAKNNVFGNGPHFYQLGNELDRSKYEWSHSDYAERSKGSVDAIRKNDDKARFIAFLREFKYRYRDKSRGQSHHADLMADVLKALPGVTDYSLMQYYDGLRADGKNWNITFWLRKTQESINLYKKERQGETPGIWITEHARQSSSNQAGQDNTRHVTSSLGGAISTADYLTAMMQVPAVQGMFWHALNAGPWQLFDANVSHNDLRPRPLFWSQSLLRRAVGNKVYSTVTHSTNKSGYAGGYDIRAVAFGHSDDAKRFSVWIINRSQEDRQVTLKIAELASKAIGIKHQYLAGKPGVDADDEGLEPTMVDNQSSQSKVMDAKGQLPLTLPASSVSTLELTLQ